VTPKQQLDSFIDRYTPELARTFRDVLRTARKIFPGATELVYDNYGALAIGFAAGERAGGAPFSIVAYPRWVSFFFLQNGAQLDDPAKRLQGSGKIVRHIVLNDGSKTLLEPEIQDLIQRALANAAPPLPQNGRAKIIIKSISAKQRPRRPNR
jgi:hypothetical protein